MMALHLKDTSLVIVMCLFLMNLRIIETQPINYLISSHHNYMYMVAKRAAIMYKVLVLAHWPQVVGNLTLLLTFLISRDSDLSNGTGLTKFG